ncbi:YeeE/YedE thiosulfate transporter family protein [Streptomyces sp. NPDC046805]|uniref:YeeE/YedE family protein n=1 Tax=Streptomyces sp. NPDC046805 TaxID=3155134 RepID=UPI0033D857A0
MSSYWPWWAGAVGLALVTINYTLITDRSFGVSAAWDRVLHWRRERHLEQTDEEFSDDQALAEALAAATAEHFGTGVGAGASTMAQAPYGTSQTLEADLEADAEPAASERPVSTIVRPAPLVTQAALLISVFVGGFIAAVSSGRFHLRYDMGPGFRNLVTANPTAMVILLFVGGVLVGFGTRLAGGCSSGHGLNGCGRLRPVSLVATAVFFGTAVAVSFLLWKVI